MYLEFKKKEREKQDKLKAEAEEKKLKEQKMDRIKKMRIKRPAESTSINRTPSVSSLEDGVLPSQTVSNRSRKSSTLNSNRHLRTNRFRDQSKDAQKVEQEQLHKPKGDFINKSKLKEELKSKVTENKNNIEQGQGDKPENPNINNKSKSSVLLNLSTKDNNLNKSKSIDQKDAKSYSINSKTDKINRTANKNNKNKDALIGANSNSNKTLSKNN